MTDKDGKQFTADDFFARCMGENGNAGKMMDYCEKFAGCGCAGFMQRFKASGNDVSNKKREKSDGKKTKTQD